MKIKGLLSEAIVPVFARISLKDAYLKLSDGASTPNTLLVKIGEGNMTYSEKRNMEYMLNRGVLDDVREGDEIPVDVSFDYVWQYIIGNGSAEVSVEDFLKRTNGASAYISSDPDACRPYAVDITIEYMPNPYSCGDKETITLADFRYEGLDHDVSNASCSCSGRCNITKASIERAAQSSTA